MMLQSPVRSYNYPVGVIPRTNRRLSFLYPLDDDDAANSKRDYILLTKFIRDKERVETGVSIRYSTTSMFSLGCVLS